MPGRAKTISRFVLKWSLSMCGVALVCASAVHRAQLDTAHTQSYTTSPWVAIEMILLITVLALLILQAIRAVYLIVKRRWRALGLLVIDGILGVVCMVLAMLIDAPTLVYMT